MGETISFLQELGYPIPSGSRGISGDEASTSEIRGVAVGYCHGWTVLTDWTFMNGVAPAKGPSLWPEMDASYRAISRGSRAFFFVLDGAGLAYMFAWYKNGKNIRTRLRLLLDEKAYDHGKPLPEEVEIWGGDATEEGKILALMSRLSLSYDIWVNAEFTLYTFDAS